jgi:CubicO group peptidase (beta-lactamase class C family)
LQEPSLAPLPLSIISQIETYLLRAKQEQHIPSLSAVVVYDRHMLWANAFGHAQVDLLVQAQPQSIYRIGSITKVFTATLLMVLRDAGIVQLDDPLVKYLPEFRIPSRFANMSPLTLRQLASHTAGLPVYAPIDYDLRQTAMYPPIEVIIASLVRSEQTFHPLTRIKYSNLGYALLGHALARAVGMRYERAMEHLILEPLGMTSSGFTVPAGNVERGVLGYERDPDDGAVRVAPQPHLGGFSPSGQLYSSVLDLAQFLMLQFHDGPAHGSPSCAVPRCARCTRRCGWHRTGTVGWGSAGSSGA